MIISRVQEGTFNDYSLSCLYLTLTCSWGGEGRGPKTLVIPRVKPYLSKLIQLYALSLCLSPLPASFVIPRSPLLKKRSLPVKVLVLIFPIKFTLGIRFSKWRLQRAS